MQFPLANAAYVAFRDGKPATDATMRAFIESHGITVDPDKLKRGSLLQPYWQQIEAKLQAEAQKA